MFHVIMIRNTYGGLEYLRKGCFYITNHARAIAPGGFGVNYTDAVACYNNMLYTNYNVGMHYKNIKQGVPNKRNKKIKRNSLPPLFMGNNAEQRMLSNTFSSKFSSNKKLLFI